MYIQVKYRVWSMGVVALFVNIDEYFFTYTL